MLKAFQNTISLVLNIPGLQIFDSKVTYFSRIRRAIFYALNFVFVITQFWIIFKPNGDFGDRIFCVTFICALVGSFVQLATLEIKKSDFNEILDWIRYLHEGEHDPLVQRFGKDLYEKSAIDAVKMIR